MEKQGSEARGSWLFSIRGPPSLPLWGKEERVEVWSTFLPSCPGGVSALAAEAGLRPCRHAGRDSVTISCSNVYQGPATSPPPTPTPKLSLLGLIDLWFLLLCKNIYFISEKNKSVFLRKAWKQRKRADRKHVFGWTGLSRLSQSASPGRGGKDFSRFSILFAAFGAFFFSVTGPQVGMAVVISSSVLPQNASKNNAECHSRANRA